jgi:hypothetical protein
VGAPHDARCRVSFPPFGVTVPSLSTYQLSYLDLTMGPGTAYGFNLMEGFDQPDIRNGDLPRARDRGEQGGLDFEGGRDIILTGRVLPDSTSLQHATSALAGVHGAQQAEQPLWFQFPNLPILASMVKPRKGTAPFDVQNAGNLTTKVLGYHATDPRLYSAPSQSTIGSPSPIVGVTFNIAFNVAFGGGSSVSVLTITNAGNVETRPILVLTGPLTNPTVVNETTGWSLTFNNPASGSFTLNAGDTLTIDTDTRSVLYVASGTTAGANRSNWIVPGSIWPNDVAPIDGLSPGANQIEFSSSGSSDAGSLAVNYSSGYSIT